VSGSVGVEVMKKVSLHKGDIFSFTFSNDFSMLATCSNDTTCLVLDPITFDVYMKFDKKNSVRTAFFYPMFNEDRMEKFHIFIGGGQDAKEVALTEEKGSSFETRIFSLLTGKDLGQIKGHFGPVHSLEISPDGWTMATASEDGTIRC